MDSVLKLMALKGRVALVTGATGHLGVVICETLAELGANIIALDHPNSNFNQVTEVVKLKYGREISVYRCDLQEKKYRDEVIGEILSKHSKLDIIVNNAAIGGKTELKNWAVPFELQNSNIWEDVFQVNLISAFDICQGFYSQLKGSEGGVILNIGSIYGVCGPQWDIYNGTTMSNPAGYAASKGGLLQLTRWLATTMAPKVRVNSISPGGILRGQDESFIKKYVEKTPLGRMAVEDDFRGAVAYLCSDLSSYVTGQNIMVDGGWSSY